MEKGGRGEKTLCIIESISFFGKPTLFLDGHKSTRYFWGGEEERE